MLKDKKNKDSINIDFYDNISIISKSTNLSDDNFSDAYEEIRDILLTSESVKIKLQNDYQIKQSNELPLIKSQNSKKIIHHYDKKEKNLISGLKVTRSINNNILSIKNKSPISSIKNNFYSTAVVQEKLKPILNCTNTNIRLKTSKKCK
jgi:hypothetical protein